MNTKTLLMIHRLKVHGSKGEKEVSSNYISPANDEVTYSSLYETKTQLRGTGSYLGPFFGLAFPSDSAVRTSTAHIDYKSNSGYFLGFRAGNDFGSSRIEGGIQLS